MMAVIIVLALLFPADSVAAPDGQPAEFLRPALRGAEVLKPVLEKNPEHWTPGDEAVIVGVGGSVLESVQQLLSKEWVPLGPDDIESLRRAFVILGSYQLAVAKAGSPEFAVAASVAQQKIALRARSGSDQFWRMGSRSAGQLLKSGYLDDRAVSQVVRAWFRWP